MERARKISYALAALAALFTFIVYLPALRNEFVNWDDDRYIFENLHIRSLGAEFFRWAFFDFHASNWHPLTWISHAVDYALWGLNPLGHHLTSIILHAVNTALVILLAMKLLETARERSTRKGAASFLNDRTVLIAAGVTGLLFGVHPVHVESAAWIMERKDLLCALFFLLSIMAYTNYAVSRQSAAGSRQPEGGGKEEGGGKHFFTHRHFLLSLLLFILALMSKPMAVTLPVVLLILDWYPFGRIRSLKAFWSAGVEKIPFVALTLASSIITIAAQRSGGSLSSLDVVPLQTRSLVAARALAAYLGKMLLPLNLSPFYPYPQDASLSSLEYLSAIGLVLAITVACAALFRKRKIWLAAWGYYLVTLVPVLGIIQVGGQSMADRYTYLPSLGPFLAVGSAVSWLAARMRQARGVSEYRFTAALVIIVFAPLSWLTVQHIQVWQNSISLWDQVLKKEPDVQIALVNRGLAYLRRGQFEKALDDLNNAIMRRPDHRAHYNRGILFAKLELLPQAIADYSAAISLNPSFYDAYNNRGVLYQRQGQDGKAFADYSAAISLRPSHFRSYVNRGLVLERAGRIPEAMADFDRAIALNPGHPDAYYNRGLLFLDRLGKHERALADFDRAIALNPDDPDAYFHRGQLFDRMGQPDRALADLDRTISLNPSYYQAYYSRSSVFRKTGQVERADRDLAIWKEHSTKR